VKEPLLNLMKPNRSECKVLHLGSGNSCYQYKLGDERIEPHLERFIWIWTPRRDTDLSERRAGGGWGSQSPSEGVLLSGREVGAQL